jgi:hypothetical protein
MRKQSPDKLAIIDQEQAGGYSVTAKFGRTEMPFGRRRRFHFKGKTPVSYKLALSLFACSVFFEIGARLAIPKWSPVAPDAIHSCAFHMRNGAVYFVQPWLGKYLNLAGWINAILFAFVVVVLLLHRNELERTS